jgi:hypothetical protein
MDRTREYNNYRPMRLIVTVVVGGVGQVCDGATERERGRRGGGDDDDDGLAS